MIRSFDWRDFPNLHRNRNEGIWLDTSLALTRWMGLVPAGALLASIAPATGIYTFVATNEGNGERQVIGQFYHTQGTPNAKLTFITPEEAIETHDVPHLLDHLAGRAGERGAHNLLAEVNERSAAYDVLRSAGFAVYGRQRIWHLQAEGSTDNVLWRPVVETDEHFVHYLYHSLVPGLVQQIEPPPWEDMHGLLYEENGEALAYLHLSYGPKGILAQPLVHPDTDRADELLRSIHTAIPDIRSRPVYLCVRSHQAWLTPFLEEMNIRSGQRQAVMVKRMAVALKEPALQTAKNALEKAQPKISTYTLRRQNGQLFAKKNRLQTKDKQI